MNKRRKYTLRNGDATLLNMDNLSYVYSNTAKPNRLTQITDAVGTTPLADDLETQAANNYTYDKIGNMTGDLSEGGKTVSWNVYNKITNVSMSSGTKTLAFGYDAAGNRVRKESMSGGTTTKQWYVRDAQGNIMSTYKQVGTGTLKQEYVYLYGSTRTGEYLLNRDSAATWNRHYYRVKGNRHYELTNHLGNVLAVVTDRKIAKDTTADATYTPQFFMPDVFSAQNYYAFGQSMPNWSGTAAVNDPKKYRFGMNGQERDTEFPGGNTYYAKFWEYDARSGRRFNLDPKPDVSNSSYACFANSPLQVIDIQGDTTYRFSSSTGSYLGMYDLDQAGSKGSYGENKELKDKSTYWNGEYFDFADPVNDTKQIRDGIITKLIIVSESRIEGILDGQGAFNFLDKDDFTKFYSNSTGGKKFDYSYSQIPRLFRSEGASTNPLLRPSPILFLPEGDHTAHNHMNFGNFLWAASGYSLGFEVSTLQFGGHLNSIINPRSNGYRPQFDSPDDQNSIKKGAYYAEKNRYRDIVESRRIPTDE